MRCTLLYHRVGSSCLTSGNFSDFLEMSDPIELSYNRLLNRDKLHNRKAIVGDHNLCSSGDHGFYPAPIFPKCPYADRYAGFSGVRRN